MGNYYLSHKGVEQLDLEIQRMNERILKNSMDVTKAHDEDSNSWHDNAVFDQALAECYNLNRQLDYLKNQRKNFVLIEKHKKQDCVDIEDDVVLEIFGKSKKYTLSALFNSELDHVSINSLCGQAIYKRKKGEEVKYLVDGKVVRCKILDILKK